MDDLYIDQVMEELGNIEHNITNITETINNINEHIYEFQNHLNLADQIPPPLFYIPNEVVEPPPVLEVEERTITLIPAAEVRRQNDAAYRIQRAWTNFYLYL